MPDDPSETAADAGEGRPEPERLTAQQSWDIEHALAEPFQVRSWSLVLLLALAIVFALRAGREFLLPVFVAIHLQFVLGPLVRSLWRLGLHPALGAALVMVGLMSAAAGLTIVLWEPTAQWLEEIPRALREIRAKLIDLGQQVSSVSEASQTVQELGDLVLEDEGTIKVKAASDSSLVSTLLAGTGVFLANCLVAGVLLFFLLARQDTFLAKVVTVLPRLREKRLAVEVVRTIESRISRYLVTITMINTVLGFSVGTTLALLGMPSPLLWGLMAGLFNFVPYLGTAVGVSIVAVVGLLTFDTVMAGLWPALAYLSLSAMEGNFVTPVILGRRFRLSPVVLFTWLMLWSWLWGVPGALMAVPMLVMVAITCDTIPALKPFGTFLTS